MATDDDTNLSELVDEIERGMMSVQHAAEAIYRGADEQLEPDHVMSIADLIACEALRVQERFERVSAALKREDARRDAMPDETVERLLSAFRAADAQHPNPDSALAALFDQGRRSGRGRRCAGRSMSGSRPPYATEKPTMDEHPLQLVDDVRYGLRAIFDAASAIEIGQLDKDQTHGIAVLIGERALQLHGLCESLREAVESLTAHPNGGTADARSDAA